MFHLRGGHFTTALHYAKRSSVVAVSIEAPAAAAFADCMVGRVLFLKGDLDEARTVLENSLQYWSRPRRAGMIYLAADRHYRAGVALARTLWLQGHPAQAIERAHQAIEDVKGHPVSLTGALAWVIGVFFWAGDLPSAETYIDRSISDAQSHALGPHVADGQGLKGQLAIHQRDAVGGVDNLQRCLEILHEARYGLLTTEFNISLAQGLAATGRLAESLTLIDRTIQLVETNGDIVYLPELLRVKGDLLLSGPQPSEDDAEICLTRSLEWSRRQGARAWELRAATDLAALRVAQGRSDCARALLQPVLQRFVEGFDTDDLIKARQLLASSS
jgi:tetratricopeptide (TPR) repeat protein